MKAKSIIFFITLPLLLIGCSKEKIDMTYLLESDEIVISASTFQDGKKTTNISKKGIISDKEDKETFYNYVSGIYFTDISSNKAKEIYTKNEQSNSLLVVPTILDNSKNEIQTMLTFYEDGTVIMIEFEGGIGKRFYKPKTKDKSFYKEIYKWYEKKLVNTLKIQ
jgi:hypothetical protein